MSKYEMPNPKAWLDNLTELTFDSYASSRHSGFDPFTGFTNVLRRSNPLLPLCITGPLDTLSTRVLAYWKNVPREKVEFYDLKLELLAAFCSRIENLSLFRLSSAIEPNRATLDGTQFYMRPASRSSSDPPFPNAKRGERLEAAETLYFITVILSTAEDKPSVPPAPEGAVRYIPYYDTPRYLTAPKRLNAASLAVAARFFRLDTRPEPNVRVFRFESTAEGWAWGPHLEGSVSESQQAGPSESNEQQGSSESNWLNDEAGYRRIASVMGNVCSTHGGVSYFVLKLITVLKEHKAFQSAFFPDRDEGLTAMHAPLYTPLTLISPLLIFARSQITLKDHPRTGTLLHMYTYGCTPICVNGIVDMGVYNFQKDLIDGVIEKAFVRDGSCKDMRAAWGRFGARMVQAVKKLLASPSPLLPAIVRLKSSPGPSFFGSSHQSIIPHMSGSMARVQNDAITRTSTMASDPVAKPTTAKSLTPQPVKAESPPAGPIKGESPPDEPVEATPPAEPIRGELPPDEPVEATLPPTEPPSLAKPVRAMLDRAQPNRAGENRMVTSATASATTGPKPSNDLFNNVDDLTGVGGTGAIPPKERLAPAGKTKKAANGQPKRAVAFSPPGKRRPRQPSVTGDHPVSRHECERSLSAESEEPFPDPRPALSNAKRRPSGPVPKTKRIKIMSPADSDVAPMITAFPLDPVVGEGRIMEYGDLLQPSVESTNSGSDEPVMEVDLLSGPRMVMDLELPTAVYDPEADEIRIEKQQFCFPYQAMVDNTGKPLPEENQPDCKPILRMVELWRQSEEAVGMNRPNVRAIAKSAFLALSEEERGDLLDDFLVIKDTNLSSDFSPQPIASSPVTSKPVLVAANDKGENFVTDAMESHAAPLIARFPPFLPYKSNVDVTFRSVRTLAPGKMLDTAVVDFCVRYLHKRMRNTQPAAAKAVVAYPTMFCVALHNWVKGGASPDHDAPLNPTGRAQFRRLVGGLPMVSADYWVLPLHSFAHFALAVVVKPWACLSEASGERTAVLYFDSLCERMPLVSSSLIARAVIELDAIRAQIPVGESIDVSFVEEVGRRITFVKVKVQEQAGGVDSGLHVVHNLRVLFKRWTVIITRVLAGCGNGMFNDELDVSALRHEVGEWLLLNAATPISLSSYNRAHWSSLPPSLALSYVRLYIDKHLGMDPYTIVEVQASGKQPERCTMAISEVALELLKGPDAKRLSALSMATSGVHNVSEIHTAVSDDNRSLIACSSGGVDATLTTGLGIGFNAWCTMSAPGTFHSGRFDANGLVTLVSVLEGYEVWLWGRCRDSTGRLTPFPCEGQDWHWSLFKDYDVFLLVLGPGDTGVMGPGVPHAVASVQQAGSQHVPAVALGSRCLNRFSMVASLHGAIRHAFWHDIWMNTMHDDRDFAIARMLAWQATRMNAGAVWPFQGKNLYALLTMGIIPLLLRSLPFSTQTSPEWLDHYDPLGDPPYIPTPADNFLQSVRQKMTEVSRLIIKQLSDLELARFRRFWAYERGIFIQEFESRCRYNKQIA